MNQEYYIHQQLEPTDILKTGNYKRHKELPTWMAVRDSQDELKKIEAKAPVKLTEQEKDKMIDELLNQ